MNLKTVLFCSLPFLLGAAHGSGHYLSTPYALAAQAMDPSEPVVPDQLVESIRADLELIDVLLPGAASWWALGPFIPGQLGLYLTYDAALRWGAGEWHQLEALLGEYDGEVTDFRQWDTLEAGWLDIEFTEPLNTLVLREVFDALEGVQSVSLNPFGGDFDRAFYVPENDLYIFRHGYGDCWSGCIHQDLYYFTVTDGEVTPLDADEARTLAGFAITSTPENLSVDTHEPVSIAYGITFPREYTYLNVNWYRSDTPDFEESEQVGGGRALEIPFARLADAGWYRAVFNLMHTNLSFTGDPIHVEVTDDLPTDPQAVAEIADPAIRDHVLDRLGIDAPPVGRAELTDLRHIDLGYTWLSEPVTSLEGLQDATSLYSIRIGSSAVQDLSPIAGLNELNTIVLGSTNRSEPLELDVGPLAGHPELHTLELNNYRIADLAGLADLPDLTNLSLVNCGISSLSPLAPLDLWNINVNENPVSDIALLLQFPKLRRVDLEDTPVDFSEDSPQRPVIDALIARGVKVIPLESMLPTLYSEETWIPAMGGNGSFYVRPGIADTLTYCDADWVTVLGNGQPHQKVRFTVEPNPGPEPRSVRVIVHNLSHVIHQLGNSGPWRNAVPTGNGWRWSEWLGYLYPVSGNWIYSSEHGWLYVLGDAETNLLIYDAGLGDWLMTGSELYPFLYCLREEPAWLYYYRGGSPQERWFHDLGTGIIFREGD